MQRISSAITKMLPLALTAFAFSNAAIAQNQLTAIKVAQPPKLEALASDAAWAKAAPLTVKLSSGANFKDGATTVTLKAVYTTDTLYMLVQYDDPIYVSENAVVNANYVQARLRAGATGVAVIQSETGGVGKRIVGRISISRRGPGSGSACPGFRHRV